MDCVMNLLQPLQPFTNYLWLFAVIISAGVSFKITTDIKNAEIDSLRAEISLFKANLKSADELAKKEQAKFEESLKLIVADYNQQLSQIQKDKEDSDKAWLKSTLEVSREIVQTKNDAEAAENRINLLTEQLKAATSGDKEILSKWLEEAKINSRTLAEKLDSLECLERKVPTPTIDVINKILGTKP